MEKWKLYFLNNKKYFILGISMFIITITIICLYYLKDSYNEKLVLLKQDEEIYTPSEFISNEEIKVDNDKQDNSIQDSKEEVIEYIYVDIKGHVNKPGVYRFNKKENKRINDLINEAGGIKKDGDTSLINLARLLYDEMTIIIYSKNEINNFSSIKKQQEEKLEICEKDEIKNDGCIEKEDITNSNTNNEYIDNSKDTNQEKQEASDKININTATKEQLMNLTGIGESKADNIIKYREEKGLFSKIEDIMNVSGIGESAFEKIKDNITV